MNTPSLWSQTMGFLKYALYITGMSGLLMSCMNEEEAKAYEIQHKKEYPRQYPQYKGNYLFSKADSTLPIYNTYWVELDLNTGDTAKAYIHNKALSKTLRVELVDLLQDNDQQWLFSDEEIIDVVISEDVRENRSDSTHIQRQ